jgi:hypothetical protein
MFKHLRKINGEVKLKVRARVGGREREKQRESFKTDLRFKSKKDRVRKREGRRIKIERYI